MKTNALWPILGTRLLQLLNLQVKLVFFLNITIFWNLKFQKIIYTNKRDNLSYMLNFLRWRLKDYIMSPEISYIPCAPRSNFFKIQFSNLISAIISASNRLYIALYTLLYSDWSLLRIYNLIFLFLGDFWKWLMKTFHRYNFILYSTVTEILTMPTSWKFHRIWK